MKGYDEGTEHIRASKESSNDGGRQISEGLREVVMMEGDKHERV